MSFEIKPASRTGINALVGFFGKSGSGKTLSALKFARGLVGPNGRIVLVDSESGRGSLYADIITGGYGIINIDPPFSPDRYAEAVQTAEANADVVVVDSLSHEWSGEGGVLDMSESELQRMAGDDWAKRERVKMASWIRPKQAHKNFIQNVLLRLKCGLIVCLRGEEKTHMVKDANSKTQVVTDHFSSPIFDSRFLFELLVCLETVSIDGRSGFVISRKPPHPSLVPLMPQASEQVSEKHGEALAQWCGNPSRTTTTVKLDGPSTAPVTDALSSMKRELWKITEHIHQGNKRILNQHLIDENFISDTESLETLTVVRLNEVLLKLKAK